MRPSSLYINETLYWTIPVYNSSGILLDADTSPAPAVAVRKNGSSTGTSATVNKRSATTGIYDASYNPSGEAAGDIFTFDETIYISGQAYFNSFAVTIVTPERGTDSITGFSTSSQVYSIESNLSGLIANISTGSISGYATTTQLNTVNDSLSGLIVAVDDNLATTARLNTIEGNLSGLVVSVDDLLATTSRLNTVESNLSGLVTNISLSGATISAAVDLSATALEDVANIFGNSERGMVYHVLNVAYTTTCT